MMDKLNVTAIEEYSQSLAKRLAAYFYIDNEVITGKQILSFFEIQQVNLLTIANLFDAWQQETARLRSPYFNYEAAEVKEALKQFMDTVSRHISVPKEHFEPLLARAIGDTLFLLLQPRQYFLRWHSPENSGLFSLDYLKERLRYIQFNKFLLKGLIEKMEKEGVTSASAGQVESWLDDLMQTSPELLEKPDRYVDQFSDKLPLELDALYQSAAANIPSVAQPEVVAPPKHIPEEQPAFVLESKPEGHRREETAEPKLSERLGREHTTLNDYFGQTHRDTGERHLKTRIENIKSAIPLNQKFVFINELFGGDIAAYHQALNELEQCDNYQAASRLLHENYARSYGWNLEGEEVESFLEIIERKFY